MSINSAILTIDFDRSRFLAKFLLLLLPSLFLSSKKKEKKKTCNSSPRTYSTLGVLARINKLSQLENTRAPGHESRRNAKLVADERISRETAT